MSNLTPSFSIFKLNVGSQSFLVESPSMSRMMVISGFYKLNNVQDAGELSPWFKSITSYPFTTVDKDTVNEEDVIPYKTLVDMMFKKTHDVIGEAIAQL